MQINKKLIAIKAHYFALLGSNCTVLPFVMVMAIQMGVPVSIAGMLNAFSLIMVLFFKPIIATIADTFPSLRRGIFLLSISLGAVTLGSIYFIPSMQDIPRLRGHLVSVANHTNASVPTYLFSGRNLQDRLHNKSAKTYDECYIATAVDCMITCTQCSINTLRVNLDHVDVEESEVKDILRMNLTTSLAEEPPGDVVYHFLVNGLSSSADVWQNISIECPRPEWKGQSCPGVVDRWEFWVFIALLMIGVVNVSTSISFTDAIIIDTIGNDGNYGAQRAWGTIGWGVISLLNGFLIDLWSGSSLDKNWAPAFVVFAVLCVFDVLVSAIFLKVPKIKSSKPVIKEVLPFLCKPHFIVFCIFTVFGGMFDGFCVYFLLLMQEDMARGTSALDTLRFTQGITLFVQCSLEAPLMFVNHWFMRKFGAQRVISLVFLLYIIRFFGLAVTGMWGPVWSTMIVELLNGPCYGLGFTAVVVYSASVSPKGTTTTVQSLVNVLYESIGYATSLVLGGVISEVVGFTTMYLMLGCLAILIFTLHVISLYVWPSLDAVKKSKPISEDQEVHNSKTTTETKTSEIEEKACDDNSKICKETLTLEGTKNDDMIEVSRL